MLAYLLTLNVFLLVEIAFKNSEDDKKVFFESI